MSDIGHNSGLADGELLQFVERVETIEAEIADLNSDKSDLYKEAKGRGFDVKVLRKIIARRKVDPAERAEEDAILDLYLEAIRRAETSRVHVHTHAPTRSRTREAPELTPTAAAATEGGFDEARVEPAVIDPDRRQSGYVGRHLPHLNQSGVTAGETATNLPEPPHRPAPADRPRKPLIEGGLSWRNFVEAYGWPVDEVQIRYQSFAGGPPPSGHPHASSQSEAAS